MIKYTLRCDDGHAFESWFASGAAFDDLVAAGHVSCALCGSARVRKAVMAPRVATARPKAAAEAAPPAPAAADDTRAALRRMRRAVEDNATYVGDGFARAARDMYLGDAPDAPIWGEANLQEAKALIDDGVPVAPLPFIPTRKVN